MDRWSRTSRSSGFVSISDVYTLLQSCGYQPSQVRWHLERLLRRNLIEQASKTRDITDLRVPFFRITSVGAYYVKRLISMFAYVDAMVVDTPITDTAWRTKMTQVYRIKERLSRAEVFVNYLDSAWQQGDSGVNAFDWKVASSLIRRDIQYVNGKASTKEHETIPPPLVPDE